MSLDLNLPLTININYTHNYDKVDYCLDSRDNEFCTKSGIYDLDLFEKIMDTLDKEWFKKKQEDIDKVELISPGEVCDVCTKKESIEDPILVCQGCNISVHRDCYGSSYDKEEFFLCQCCLYYDLDPICIFCNQTGGVMKMTPDYKFGHILCVIFDKTIDFDNPISREPIFTGEYKQVLGPCCLCGKSDHTKIECSFGLCMNIYHMGCSLKESYYDVANKISYCSAHDPTLKKNMFTSNASFKNLYSGYAKLQERPIIRKKIEMKDLVDTEYIKIIKSDPEISKSTYKKLQEDIKDNFLDSICQYWLSKRRDNKRYGISYLRHIKRI